MRKEQSILITTHYMEEAEVLADRIWIMSHGQVLCNGTSMELKRQYATGYALKLLTSDTLNLTDVMKLIHRHIPEATTKVYSEKYPIKIKLISYFRFRVLLYQH